MGRTLEFKKFLLNEGNNYLGEKIGDILNSVQNLVEDGPHLGKRQLRHHAKQVVSDIRRLLHSSWSHLEKRHLKVLQKVGVAIMKSIEDTGDTLETLQSAVTELQTLSGEIGSPVHNIARPEGGKEPKETPPGDAAPVQNNEQPEEPQPQQNPQQNDAQQPMQ